MLLLERNAELQRVEHALELAAAGEGSLLVIEGPGGIGKTELLETARRRAGEQGMAVATGRGSELEREFAFGVVRQLFEPAVAHADATTRADLLSGAAALAAPLFAAADLAAAPEPGFATSHGLYWLGPTWPSASRCCSPSTTRTGPTSRHCASSPTSHNESKGCRWRS